MSHKSVTTDVITVRTRSLTHLCRSELKTDGFRTLFRLVLESTKVVILTGAGSIFCDHSLQFLVVFICIAIILEIHIYLTSLKH